MDDIRVIVENVKLIFPQYSEKQITNRIIHHRSRGKTADVLLQETIDDLIKENNQQQTNTFSKKSSDDEEIEKDAQQNVLDIEIIKNIFSDIDPASIDYLADLGYAAVKIIALLEDHSSVDQAYIKFVQAKKNAEAEYRCNICTKKFLILNMLPCTDGHLACRTCLKNYAQEAINGQGELKCMEKDCTCGFGFQALESVLGLASFAKYLRVKENAEDKCECKVCTQVVLFSNMASCTDGHLICGECLQNCVYEMINSKTNGNVKCIDQNCTCGYTNDTLGSVLDPKCFAEYLQYLENVEAECECNICCETVLVSNMVSCSNGHLFCQECLRKYAKEVIYGQASVTLTCLDNDCDCEFSRLTLETSLDPEWIEKLDERMQVESINGADITNLFRCKFCHYAVIIDGPIGRNTAFKCQNWNCKKMYCLYCGLDWKKHDKNDCEKDGDTSLRKSTEEKMTEAIIRQCHKCKAEMVKEDGCNKMTCRCGATMCYVCRTPNINYGHFCTHLRNPTVKKCSQCNACYLWEDVRKTVDANNLARIKMEAKQAEQKHGWNAGKIVSDN